MRTKNRIISAITFFALTLSLALPAFASSPSSYVIVEDDMLYSTTSAQVPPSSNIIPVSRIQELLNERTSALLDDDQSTYDEITQTLRTYGVKEVAYEDIPALLGEDSLPSSFSNPDESYTTDNSIFEYYYTTYNHGSTTYDIMRILASPNPNAVGDTILYQSGSITLHSAKPATLIGMELLGIGVESLLGVESIVGAPVAVGSAITFTLFDVIDTISSGLSTSSEVSSVSASYIWNVAEDCSWIYVSKKGEGNYQLAGCYHKASMGILIGIPNLIVEDMNSTAYVKGFERQITAYPENYDSIFYALDSYVKGRGVYMSSITELPITGLDGKTVKMVKLSNPYYPLYAQ